MKKILFSLLIMLLINNLATSQSCLPNGITFFRQADIDYFQVNYPGCTQILGNVTIDDNYSYTITNLNGLNVLTAIEGNLTIINNPLTNLNGLEGLKYIKGNVYMVYNTFQNLAGLNNLKYIGGDLQLESNSSLTSLNGLNELDSIGGSLLFYYNALGDLTGLEALHFVGGELFFYATDNLTSLAGLDHLDSVGTCLTIRYANHLASIANLVGLKSIGAGCIEINSTALTTLAGLENINGNLIKYLKIIDNDSLSMCAIKSICDYLSIPYAWGDFDGNSTGCNSNAEVKSACGIGINEITILDNFLISPNPFSKQTTIEFHLKKQTQVNIDVFNSLGEKIATISDETFASGTHHLNWNPSDIPVGIYLCRISTNSIFPQVIGKILVINN